MARPSNLTADLNLVICLILLYITFFPHASFCCKLYLSDFQHLSINYKLTFFQMLYLQTFKKHVRN